VGEVHAVADTTSAICVRQDADDTPSSRPSAGGLIQRLIAEARGVTARLQQRRELREQADTLERTGEAEELVRKELQEQKKKLERKEQELQEQKDTLKRKEQEFRETTEKLERENAEYLHMCTSIRWLLQKQEDSHMLEREKMLRAMTAERAVHVRRVNQCDRQAKMLREKLCARGHKKVPLLSVPTPPSAERSAAFCHDCPVCMYACDGECNRMVLSCGHTLHATCGLQWADRCIDGFSCPMCRVTAA
jgi:hypothetical protein